MSKRILCLSDGFSSGGAERQLIGLAHYLKEEGYDAELGCYHDNKFYEFLINEYNLKCITLHPRGRISKVLQVRKLILNGNYDYIIAYKDGATMITCILKLLGIKAKLIVSERNTTQFLSNYERIKFLLYKFADFVVPNSFTQAKFIKEKFPYLESKVVTITNFTDTSCFIPSDCLDNTKTNVIVIAARIAEQKNILRFLNVVKKLKDSSVSVHFKWFGNVSYNYKEYVDNIEIKLHELAIVDMIEFFPATLNIKEEYQKCDAFCLPSLYEGYPNVICEAMSCGKPILCSRVCDNSYIVEEGNNGFLFDPLNEDNMVEVIKKFINLSIEERMEMGYKSRKMALEKFSADIFVKKYIDLIES